MKKVMGTVLVFMLALALFAMPAAAEEQTIKFQSNDVTIDVIDDFSTYGGLDTSGQFTQGWSFEDEMLTVYYGGGGLALSEYTWDLTGADVGKLASAKYIGFRMTIANDDYMAISVQPAASGKSPSYMSDNTDYPVYFVQKDGTVLSTEDQEVLEFNGRYCVTAPDEFDGYMIIDVRRFCDISDRSGSNWDSIKDSFNAMSIYFDCNYASAVDVTVDDLFVITSDLPEVVTAPTDGPTNAPTDEPTASEGADNATKVPDSSATVAPGATTKAPDTTTSSSFPIWAIVLIAVAVVAVVVIAIVAAKKKSASK